MTTSNSDEPVEHMLSLLVCLLEEKVEVKPFQFPAMGFLALLSINFDDITVVGPKIYVATLKPIVHVALMVLLEHGHASS